jgi:hypothetical protein
MATLEPRQRAVVIVGVNASRAVDMLDVIEGTTRLVTADGVNLGAYSTKVRFKALPQDADYRKASAVNVASGSGEGWILPAVSQGN